MPEMPESVASDDYQSQIWASVTASGRFSDEDAPNLALLCYWHAVAKAAEDAMSKGKSVKVLDPVGYKPIKAKNGRHAIMERPHPAVSVPSRRPPRYAHSTSCSGCRARQCPSRCSRRVRRATALGC